MPDTIDPAVDPIGAMIEAPAAAAPVDASTDPIGAMIQAPVGKVIPSKTAGVPGLAPEHHVARSLAAGRPFEDVAPELQAAGVSPEPFRDPYKMAEADRREAGSRISTLEIIKRQGLPFLSGRIAAKQDKDYTDAVARVKEGKATDQDYATIARWKHFQQLPEYVAGNLKPYLGETGGKIGAGLLAGGVAAPALVGESIGAGKLLGLAGRAAGIAPAVTKGGQVLRFAGGRAAMTPLMPSIYVEAAGRKNIAEGRAADDWRGYPSALALGYMNNLVLGSLQNFAGGVANPVKRAVMQGALGVSEQSVVDDTAKAINTVLPQAMKMEVGDSTFSNFLAGKHGDAAQHAATQFLTFGAFAYAHGRTSPVEAFKEAVEQQGREGVPPAVAGANVDASVKLLQDALKANPDLTKAEARALFENDQPGPVRDAALKLADALGEKPTLPGSGEVPQPEGGPPGKEPAGPAAEMEKTPAPSAEHGVGSGEVPHPPEPDKPPEPAHPLLGPDGTVRPFRTIKAPQTEAEAAAKEAHQDQWIKEFWTLPDGTEITPNPESTNQAVTYKIGTVTWPNGRRSRVIYRRFEGHEWEPVTAKHDLYGQGKVTEAEFSYMPDDLVGLRPALSGALDDISGGKAKLPATAGGQPAKPPEPPQPVTKPPSAVDVLGEQAVRDHARFWGLSPKGKIENVLKAISGSKAASASLAGKVRKAGTPPQATESRPAAPAPEPAGGPSPPPERPPAGEPATPAGQEIAPATPERYYRVPDYKAGGSNLEATRSELIGGQFAGKWFSRGRAQNEGYHGSDKFQLEFAHEHLGGPDDVMDVREKEVGIGGKAPMYLHPALTAIRFKGDEAHADFREMSRLVDIFNEERAKVGVGPIRLEATTGGPPPDQLKAAFEAKGLGPKDVEKVRAVIDAGSVNQAARNLGIAESTLHEQLDKMSEALDLGDKGLKAELDRIRMEEALGRVERGQFARPEDVKGEPVAADRRMEAKDKIRERVDRRIDQLLAEVDRGVSSDRRAEIEAEIRRLGEEVAGAQGGEQPPPAKPPGVPPTVSGRAPAGVPAGAGPAARPSGGPEPGPAQPAAGVRPAGLVGQPTRVLVPGGEPVAARYEVRELDELKPSHRPVSRRQFPATEEYPEGLQPRNYATDRENQDKVWTGAEKMETGLFLSNHPGADNGPPTVSENGTVINGNGRAMMLHASQEAGTYAKYRTALEAEAARFGIDPAAVKGMKRPVLVRATDMDPASAEAKRFAAAGNNTFTQQESPVRQAASAGRNVPDKVIAAIKLTGDETFSQAVNDRSGGRAFRQKLHDSLPPQVRAALFEPGTDLMLTDAGKEFVQNLLLTKVVPVELVEQLRGERKQLLNAVEGAIPQLLKLKAEGGAVDVTPPLLDALGVLARNPGVKSKGDAANALDQLDLFTGKRAEPVSPAARMMIDFALDYGGKPKQFRDRLAKVASGVRAGPDLFGGVVTPKSPAETVAEHLGVKFRPGARFGPAEPGAMGNSPVAPPEPPAGEAFPPPPPSGESSRGGIPGNPGNLYNPPPRTFAQAHEKVTEERAVRGRDEVMKSAARGDPQLWAQAQNILHADPQAATKIIDSLEATGRPVSDVEMMVLLNHRVALANQHDAAVRAYNAAAGRFVMQDGKLVNQADAAELAPLRRRMEDIEAARDRLDVVTRQRAGSMAGRVLRLFRVLAAEDYSLAGLMGRAQAAKGSPLTAEEKLRVVQVQKEIATADTELAAAEAGNKPLAPNGQQGDLASFRIKAKTSRDRLKGLIYELGYAGLPARGKFFRNVVETFNVARAIQTAFDLSAVFRQGAMFTFAHPIKAAKLLPRMLEALRSEDAFNRLQDAIEQDPNSVLAHQSGLYLADRAVPPAAQEEAFMGRLVHRIPGIKMSERAYTAFLNAARMDLFNTMIATVARGGRPTVEEAKAIANYVNVATGRGKLSTPFGSLEGAAVPLAQLFFSPRYLWSRFQLLAGQPLMQGTAATRTAVAKEYARALIGLGTFYAVAAAAADDAKITFDPRSTDFGKVRMGNTRIDPLAGLAQITVFGARVTTGETAKGTGKIVDIRGPKVPFGGDTVSDVIFRFLRTKLAPVPGTVIDRMQGRNVAGEPVSTPGQVGNMLLPMAVRDVYEALEDQGVPAGAAVSLLAILGMGAQTYKVGEKHPAPKPLGERVGQLVGQ